MSFNQFLLILIARRWTVVVTLLITLVMAAAASLLWPKSYTATTAVVLDPKPDPVSINSASPLSGISPFTYLSTQKEIIQSVRIASKVVKSLKLDEDSEIIREWKLDTDGRGDRTVWVARLLLKKLDVKPERDSNVLNISFTAKDPKIAALIANTFAESFVDTSLELKLEPARRYAAWFVEQTKSVRGLLEKAHSQLSEHQRDKGIVAVDEKLDVENARLADLSAQLTAIQLQKAETRSRQIQAEGDKNILPEVLQNSLIQGLKSEVAKEEAKLNQLAGQLGKNHPQYKRNEMELQSLRQKLDQEINHVAKGIGTANRVNLQREADIAASLQAQKLKVLQLKRQRDELAVLNRDVEGSQRSYDLAMQRLNQMNLESQATQTNSVVVLYPATEPVEPSRPRLMLNLVLAAIFGILLGVGLALRREVVDYRIRMIEDVTELLKLPVLGTIDKMTQSSDSPTRTFWAKSRRSPLVISP